MKSKCIVFSRVSTTQQELTQQTNAVLEEAYRNGYSKEDVIIIEGKESAISLDEEDRLTLNDLKAAIENDSNINCVFCYEVSRIARRPKVLYSIRDFLLERNVNLVILKPYLRLLDPDGKLSQSANILFSLFTSISESEMMLKKERTQRGKVRAKEMGRAVGRVIYGYRIGKGKYVEIDPPKADVVKWIFNEYVYNNSTFREIAAKLYANGTFGKLKEQSILSKISAIVRSDAYIGTKPYPAIISEQLWKDFRTKAKGNKILSKRTDGGHLCKDLVYMSGTKYKLGTAGEYYISRSEKTNQPNNMPSVRKNTLDPIALSLATELAKESTNKYVLKEKLTAQEAELHACKQLVVIRIHELNQRIDKIEERLIMGKISEAKAEELEATMIRERDKLKQEYTKYEHDIRHVNEQLSNVIISDDIDYDKMTLNEQKQLTHEYIKRIEIIRLSTYILRINIEDKYGNWHSYEANTNKHYNTYRKV